MDWSPQQDAALKKISAWVRGRGKQWFYLAGYAGTGKTTLAMEMGDAAPGGSVLYASYTGKAALVMRKKGCRDARTIHSLIYTPEEDPDTGEVHFRLDPKSELAGAGLLVIDEVSMVNEEIASDLLSFGIPILVLGDPAQLPPVKGAGFFTNNQPDMMLTEIHRQAKGNPIIELATRARGGERLSAGRWAGAEGCALVMDWDGVPQKSLLAAGQVICGTNKTRRGLNASMRAALRATGALSAPAPKQPDWMPVAGDKLICLKNNKDLGLFNGGLWTCLEVRDGPVHHPGTRKRQAERGVVYMTLSSLDEERGLTEVEVRQEFFQGREDDLTPRQRRPYHEFDFGYAITCHKSQGSQWDNVLVRDQSFVFAEMRDRWLYTAVTRAAQNLVVGR